VYSWVIQIVATAAVVLYLGHWRLMLQQRRNRSWDDLLSRLNPGWRMPIPPDLESSDQPHRAAELRILCRNAQVMQEIADYALRNFDSNFDAGDRSLAEQMHCDATYLRFWALAALARNFLGKPAGA
jgi:hypothetical protein